MFALVQTAVLVETLSAGLAPSVEASVASPLLKSPAPAVCDLLHISYQCAAGRVSTHVPSTMGCVYWVSGVLCLRHLV